jgi:hypothetical protein
MIYSLKKKNNLRLITIFLLLIVHCSLFIVLYSCKESDIVGLKQVTGQKLGINFTDTSKITAYSVKEDSVETDGTSLNLVGNIVDPVFGKTIAAFYTQVLLNTTNVTFGTAPVLDSLVLALAYDGYYGDISASQTINVYELSDDLDATKAYYSVDKKKYFSTKIASKTFIPKPKDSIYIMVNGVNTKIAPELRIKIDPDFANNKFLNASSSDLTNNTNFLKYFKGLYIAPDTTLQGGSILYFNLISTETVMTIYYHTISGTDTTYLSYDFIINTNCARFNYFNHYGFNQANSDFTKQVINKDTSLGKQVLYIEAMGGTKAKISFPDLGKLVSAENIAVNKASLVFKPNISLSSDTSVYKLPAQLALIRIKKDGTTAVPPDYSVGSAYYGGIYNKTANEYRFNLGLYVQDILSNRITGDKGLYVIVNGASANAGRLILYGPQSLYPQNLRLEISYTKLGFKSK